MASPHVKEEASLSESEARRLLADHGQEHLLRFWRDLDATERANLLAQIRTIDFDLMDRLIAQWILNEPRPEIFDHIEPIVPIPIASPERADAREAREAGEETLRAGRVGILVVAGGQGTRLGFSAPKGAYPIGPISGKSLFAYHAEKIHNLQGRFGQRLPWYIMVSDANAEATKQFFQENDLFGLEPDQVTFFLQRMVPSVDETGKFFLEARHRIAMNPNGHGGVIPALVENGVLQDCTQRGANILYYFQVDNWAVKAADPYFIGYHVLNRGEMSSKIVRKKTVREPVGVHCLCDKQYRVIEYTALGIYPQLLETDHNGAPKFWAGNPAIHILSTDFIERVYRNCHLFPWWRAHKRIPHIDERGEPRLANGYKFETFVFDALRFISHPPVALEIPRQGEYTPTKDFHGPNGVQAARRSMRDHWADWLEAAGFSVPRDPAGHVRIQIEISPRFALTKEEFVEESRGRSWPTESDLAIGPEGNILTLPQ